MTPFPPPDPLPGEDAEAYRDRIRPWLEEQGATRDALTAMRAQFDQAKSAVGEVAELVSAYYKALMETGTFGPQEAFALTMQYQAGFFSSGSSE